MEACDESWSPRSNATALVGFALTTTTIRIGVARGGGGGVGWRA